MGMAQHGQGRPGPGSSKATGHASHGAGAGHGVNGAAGVEQAQLQAVRQSLRDRVLWLSTAMIHWANNVRPSADGVKVGGHQASSASSVAILCALYFETLRHGDRVAVKPHASPVLHAIQYLLGNLPQEYLEKFRAYGGLQAYPSRTKDPDPVDFSTGSVGMAGPSAAFGALVRDYLATHSMEPTSGRFFAHIGDAELDQGSVWEAIAEPALDGLSRCVWVVDLNRQSLDRIVPGIRVQRLREMFAVNGWSVYNAKYGDALTELMERAGGHALRRRIDDMSNEEYQGIIVAPADSVRQRLLDGAGVHKRDISKCVSDVDDADLHRRIAHLGGHDVGTLARVYREAASSSGPAVVFAYTVKGWGLQSAADPRNHAALLTTEQFKQLAVEMGMDAERPWSKFEDASPESAYLRAAADQLSKGHSAPSMSTTHNLPQEPALEFSETATSFPDRCSTQDAFGRVLVEIDRTSEAAASRVVTVSADVATSTGLASWINRAGVWSYNELPDFLGFAVRTLKWVYTPQGRHIELGLSEGNMMLMLGALGLAEDHSGRRLVPIGTVYDPFVARGLDQLMSGLYMESRFILVATPSGVSLSSEGGMHQGVITPELGISMPGITYYEPCFAREVEWILLDAVRKIGAGTGGSYFLRLSTKPVDQTLFARAELGDDARRKSVLEGCWRYRTATPGLPSGVNLFAVGPMLPEALAAVPAIVREGIGVNLFCVTSPGLLYNRLRRTEASEAAGTHTGRFDPTGLLSDAEVGLPVVTVQDGHPHAMSFLGAALDCPSVNLGVDTFGQSGSRADLYRHFRIDSDAIYAAALGLVDRQRRRQ